MKSIQYNWCKQKVYVDKIQMRVLQENTHTEDILKLKLSKSK